MSKATLTSVVPKRVADKIVEMARKEERSVSQVVARLLEKALGMRDGRAA